jgi:hypothetical protein
VDEVAKAPELWVARMQAGGRPAVAESRRRLLAGEIERASVEYRYDHPRRGLIWLRHSSRRVEGEPGQCARIIEAIEDVTEYRQALEDVQRLRERLERENVYLRQEARRSLGPERIVGRGPAIRRTLALAEQVATTDSTVLLLGETGTGKERIALPEFSKDPAEEGSGLDPLLGPRGPGTRDAPVIDFGGGVKEGLGADTVPEGLSGRASVGYGSFDTPWFEGWFGRTSGAMDFLMKAGYASSGGHRPHAGFRKGHGEFRAGWSLPDDASFLPGARLEAVRVLVRADERADLDRRPADPLCQRRERRHAHEHSQRGPRRVGGECGAEAEEGEQCPRRDAHDNAIL